MLRRKIRPTTPHLSTICVPILGLCLLPLLLASPVAAQHTLFYSDFRSLGRIDSPPTVGELEADFSAMTITPVASLALLPGGEILQVGERVESIDPQTLEQTELADLDIYCRDATADGDGNLWCVHQSQVYCLAAETYDLALSVPHPGLVFRGIAALGARLYAVAYLADDYAAGPHLVEIDPATGDASVLHPLSLPDSPIEGRFFEVNGIDFDDAGDLWLGLPLYYPSIILPPPPEGYLLRILDPLGGAVPRPPQRLIGTSHPSPLVLGAPTLIAVPAVGSAGLSVLVALLVASALAIIARRP